MNDSSLEATADAVACSGDEANGDAAREKCMAAGRLAAPIYEAWGWEWGSDWRTPPTSHVPTAEEIGERIWSMYQDVANDPKPDACRSTGRLSVWRDAEDDDEIRVEVQLAEWPASATGDCEAVAPDKPEAVA